MAKRFFLVSTKAKGLQFEVVKLDKANMRATLQGDTGVPFETSIDEKTLAELGYQVKIVDAAAEAAASANL